MRRRSWPLEDEDEEAGHGWVIVEGGGEEGGGGRGLANDRQGLVPLQVTLLLLVVVSSLPCLDYRCLPDGDTRGRRSSRGRNRGLGRETNDQRRHRQQVVVQVVRDFGGDNEVEMLLDGMMTSRMVVYTIYFSSIVQLVV